MNRLRLWTVPALAALSLAFVAAPGDTLAFRVAEKAKLTKTFKIKSSMHSESFSTTMDGQDMSEGGEPEIQVDDTETYQITDEYLGVGGGRPTKLRRTYDEIGTTSTQTVKLPEGMGENQEETRERGSDMAGKKVIVRWDEKEESYSSAWDEDEKGDDEWLADLQGEVEFLAFLPKDAVASGDTWDVPGKAFNALLTPLGHVPMKAEGEAGEEGPDVEMQAKMEREFSKNRAGKATATYKGTREVDGQKLGVIALTAELESQADMSADEGSMKVESTTELEGELLWDLAAGHVRSIKLTGTAKYKMHASSSFEGPQGTIDFEQKIDFAGTTEIELEVD